MAVSSDKSRPGPATNHATPDTPSQDLQNEDGDEVEDQYPGPVETLNLPAMALVRRASGRGRPQPALELACQDS